MASQKNRPSKQISRKKTTAGPTEPRAVEAITVAWMVTVLTGLVCNLGTIAAQAYLQSQPEAQRMLLLRELLLFSGSLVGVLSLILIGVVYRIRVQPPPRGITVFAACIAVGPIIAVVIRFLR